MGRNPYSFNHLPDGYQLLIWDAEKLGRFWRFVDLATPEWFFSHLAGEHLLWGIKRHLRGAGRIFDFGAGSGGLINLLLEKGAKVAGYDQSQESVSQLVQKFAGHSGFLGVIGPEQVTESAGQFDLAFAVEVVEHLYDPQLHEALHIIKTLLRPGGKAVFTTPNDEDLLTNSICSPESGKVFHRWQHVRSWTRETLSQALEEAGLKIIEACTCNIMSWGSLNPRLAKVALPLRIRTLLYSRNPPNLVVIARS
jgi:2-polyprenyl-3-methyl-5-hydroxy-6-metoxy-1,4-benzoquinol methylase